MSGSKDSTQVLLDHGAPVNAENNDDMTPLHQAILNGHANIAVLLSKYGGHE
jgi:ankyrin repeat protein